MFQNRTSAGERLADALEDRGVEADIVLGIPRGGLPVADRLGVPLDVVAAKKLGAPQNPELAIGAVSADGSLWLNDELIDRLGVDDEFVEAERERAEELAREKERTYREEPPDLAGKRVVVVDDGLATGATAVACVRRVSAADAERVVLAVPVAALDSVETLRAEADDVVAVETPTPFGAVGAHYREFGQVSDEEAMEYLEER